MAHRGQEGLVEARRGSNEREAYWREVLAEWSRSGLSKVAFCRKRGLSPSAFHWWKGELSRRDAARGSRSARPCSAKRAGNGTEAKAKPAFVAVRVAASAAAGAAVPLRADGRVEGAVDVVLRNGHRVRVGAGFDAEVLGRVVGVLEGLAC
jgi:hypothetical protein